MNDLVIVLHRMIPLFTRYDYHPHAHAALYRFLFSIPAIDVGFCFIKGRYIARSANSRLSDILGHFSLLKI